MTSISPLLRRACGYRPESKEPVEPKLVEDVPVPCAAVPRTTFRDRLVRLRQRRGEMEGGVSSAVRSALGENADDTGEDDANSAKKSLIPKDAEELDGGNDPINRNLRKVKGVVMEPSDPYGEREELMTPQAALVAPDATPKAFEPIDPSKVPGGTGGKFTVQDLRNTKPPSAAQPSTMPVPKDSDEEQRRRITTEEAYNMLRVPSPAVQHVTEAVPAGAGPALLRQGEPMPEHKHTDVGAVMSAFRRFNG